MEVFSKIKVLYVEDEDVIRESLSRFLARRIPELYVARNGEEGLRLFEQHQPDVVITDIRMPNMSGLEMVEQIKNRRNVPVIITTGHNDEEFFLKAIDLGVEKFIKKPIEQKTLLSALEKIAHVINQDRELEKRSRFIQSILDISPQFLMVVDGGEVTFMNQSFLHFIGFENLGAMRQSGKTIDDYLVVKNEEFYKDKKFPDWLDDIFVHPDLDYVVHMQGEKLGDDEIGTFLVQVNQIPFTDQYLLSFSDITLLEIIKLLYHELAIKDPLTKVYNRRKFFDEIEKEMERSKRYKRELSLIMFDLDHFKQVNDNYGHQVGDKVLREIVDLTRQDIRNLDIIGRYGGEEFMILLPETGLDKAQSIAGRLREKTEKNQFFKAGQVTCSYGVTVFSEPESVNDFIKRVDEALYLAKANGRNRVEIKKPETK